MNWFLKWHIEIILLKKSEHDRSYTLSFSFRATSLIDGVTTSAPNWLKAMLVTASTKSRNWFSHLSSCIFPLSYMNQNGYYVSQNLLIILSGDNNSDFYPSSESSLFVRTSCNSTGLYFPQQQSICLWSKGTTSPQSIE